MCALSIAAGATGCQAGRSHTMKETVTDPNTGVVRSFEFESGISAWNTDVDLSKIEFNETLGKDGSIWSSTGKADSANASPADQAFQMLTNFGAIYRNLPIQQGASPNEDSTIARLDRLEQLIEQRFRSEVDSSSPNRVDGLSALVDDPRILLTDRDLAVIRYLRELRDQPNPGSNGDEAPPGPNADNPAD